MPCIKFMSILAQIFGNSRESSKPDTSKAQSWDIIPLPPYSSQETPGDSLSEPPDYPPDWRSRSHNLIIMYIDDPSKPWVDSQWMARMDIIVKDIPGLMRTGLHWNSTNVVPEKGFLLDKDRSHVSDGPCGWTHARRIALRDSKLQWEADMVVHARDTETLREFDIERLSVDQTLEAIAENWQRQVVYYYLATSPQLCINAIYGKEPLGGWWPWPKKQEPSAGVGNHEPTEQDKKQGSTEDNKIEGKDGE